MFFFMIKNEVQRYEQILLFPVISEIKMYRRAFINNNGNENVSQTKGLMSTTMPQQVHFTS